ncbi:hypothetical protein [Streptomyces sp. NBC_01803]|uniref:hypothetical protein n=1 Tax=Streptomyces sp. NBC_01803 TaxID=2975946 RepID=UPI002DD9043E|nr:hypothetical protein [Streptomyces sp. NBC_01803]WSA45371.1 hypothetical protein OIE51_14825 [Streptomyces sp. NBC_01803]
MTNDDRTDLEREFGAMLRQTGNGFHRDPQFLVEGGMRRGRARLWRRRTGVLGGALSATAVAVAAVYLPGLGEDGEVTAAPPETGQDMIATLAGMLPDSLVVSEVMGAAGPSTTADPYVSVVVADESGSFSVDLQMSRFESAEWRADAGCGDPGRETDVACEETELADGSLLTSRTSDFVLDGALTGSEYMEMPGAAWDIAYDAPSGPDAEARGFRSVRLSVSPYDVEGGSAAVDAPPVDFHRLAEIARDPVWQSVLNGVDVEYGAPEAFEDWVVDDLGLAGVPASDLRTMFRELAPEGLEITDGEDDDPGSASLEVGDGTHTAYLEINVYGQGSFTGEEIDVFGEGDGEHDDGCELATTLEDGTRVFQCVDISLGSWMIDVYYPDGASLDITQSVALGAAADEEVAPLSLEELTEIGSAARWRTLVD